MALGGVPLHCHDEGFIAGCSGNPRFKDLKLDRFTWSWATFYASHFVRELHLFQIPNIQITVTSWIGCACHRHTCDILTHPTPRIANGPVPAHQECQRRRPEAYARDVPPPNPREASKDGTPGPRTPKTTGKVRLPSGGRPGLLWGSALFEALEI